MPFWRSREKQKRWQIQMSFEGFELVFRVFEKDSPDAISALCLSEHPSLDQAKAAHRDRVFWEDVVDLEAAVNEIKRPEKDVAGSFEGDPGYAIYGKRPVTVSRGMPWR
jgi:hypothetical protein